MKNRKPANLHYINCHIAGFSHWEGCLVMEDLKIGSTIDMERESNNPHDNNAIALYYGDTKLGYIPASHNEEIAKFLDLGHNDLFEVRVQSKNPDAHPEYQVRIVVFIKAKGQ
ncbi:MAG: HIRAN domain-containing protein [Tidjanibacter sp.]|nr:HIRAN domain-containing protein [Tidjanibacter sp.]